jgi:uncharacterized membrane protein
MTALRRGEGGQTIVLIAAVLAVLLLAVGLAIDAGQLYVNRRAAQTAADSAAWAGAVVLFNGGNASQATSAANADAAKNGYSSGITVNSPPLSGGATCDPFFVEVLISQSVTPTFFTGARTLSVRGRHARHTLDQLRHAEPEQHDHAQRDGKRHSGGLDQHDRDLDLEQRIDQLARQLVQPRGG